MPDPSALLTLLRLVLKDRTQLALENITLRQQLAARASRPRGFRFVVAGAGERSTPSVDEVKWRGR